MVSKPMTRIMTIDHYDNAEAKFIQNHDFNYLENDKNHDLNSNLYKTWKFAVAYKLFGKLEKQITPTS
jgi:hypothetical protein